MQSRSIWEASNDDGILESSPASSQESISSTDSIPARNQNKRGYDGEEDLNDETDTDWPANSTDYVMAARIWAKPRRQFARRRTIPIPSPKPGIADFEEADFLRGKEELMDFS